MISSPIISKSHAKWRGDFESTRNELKKIFTFLFLLLCLNAFSQRRANMWLLNGTCSTQFNPLHGINFNSGSADTVTMLRRFGFFITNTSISDTSGNLLFYTNGVKIGNANHDTLQNSTDYNPGFSSTVNCNNLNMFQGALILPQPVNDSLYYVFHESGDQFSAYGINHVSPFSLKYSVVDMSLDGGLGGIISSQKSVVITNDTMANGFIAACKHGNGRDWWIVAPRFWSNKYYKLLLTTDSVRNVSSQNIGDSIIYDNGGVAAFTPDGSHYAFLDFDNNLNIFRFDRCTGLFYDSTLIDVPFDSTFDTRALGLAFSASSQYLYVVQYSHILQYDMQAANIAASQLYVADWDTFYNPLQTNFFNAQLAPDNKIYIGTWAGSYNLHYIDQPDNAGLACNVVQNTFIISTNQVGNITVPTYPNYDLGRWVGSPCDTLVTNLQLLSFGEGQGVRIVPNPANDYFNINYDFLPNENAQFVLYDVYGNVVERKNLYGSFKSLLVPTNNLSNGVYSWSVTFQNKKVGSGKLVVIH